MYITSKKRLIQYICFGFVLLTLLFFTTYSITRYSNLFRSTTPENNFPSKSFGDFDLYLVKKSSLFGATFDGKSTELVPYTKHYVEQIVRVSPLGNYILFSGPGSQIYLSDKKGEVTNLSKEFTPELWSPNEKYAVGIPYVEKSEAEPNYLNIQYELWDLTTKKKVIEVNQSPDTGYIAGITNDMKLLYLNTIQTDNSIDEPNVELFTFDTTTKEKVSIGKFIFGDNQQVVLSPDSKYLAFEHNGNVHTYNFETKKNVNHTQLQPQDFSLMAFHWSPDSQNLAFHLFNWFGSDDQKVGVLDISNQQIRYIDKDASDGFLPTTGVKKLIYFYPRGWSNDGKSLALYLEGSTGNEEKDSFWKYDFSTKKYSRLDFLDFIEHPRFFY